MWCFQVHLHNDPTLKNGLSWALQLLAVFRVYEQIHCLWIVRPSRQISSGDPISNERCQMSKGWLLRFEYIALFFIGGCGIRCILCLWYLNYIIDEWIGLAPRSITSRNEAELDYLQIEKGAYKDDSETLQLIDELKGNEFAILKKPEIISKFDTKREE